MASAVSSYDCGDSLVNIIIDSRNLDDSTIAMGMDIDKPRTDKKACRIDRFPSSFTGQVTDLNDFFVVDPDIPFKPRIPCPVQDISTLDQKGKILLGSDALENKEENAQSGKISRNAEEPLNHGFVEVPILCQEGKFCQFFCF
jgi:hypothetical protein